jgi:hypothetical protein
LLTDSVAMHRRICGADAVELHGDAASALCKLTEVLFSQGKHVEAARVCREALVALRRRSHRRRDDSGPGGVAAAGGSADHLVARQLNALGVIVASRRWPGDFAESALLLQESLAMRRRLHNGVVSRDEMDVLTSLAGVAMQQGDAAESDRLQRQCVEIRRRLGVGAAAGGGEED